MHDLWFIFITVTSHFVIMIAVAVHILRQMRDERLEFGEDDDEDRGGGGPSPEPRAPSAPSGGGAPLPDAVQSRVRLRGPGRIADRGIAPARRPAHIPSPERAPERV